MNKLLHRLLALFMVGTALPAVAHEFWMLPDRFTPSVKTPVRLTLQVGEYFEGELIPFTTAYVAALTQHAAGKKQNLLPAVPASENQAQMQIVPETAGTYLLAYDSHPNQVTLSADKFHAYLHEEGLDSIIRQREASGSAGQPGRERYRRHVKTLFVAGGKADNGYAVRTGQRLEIVPLANPYAKRPGDTLEFQVLFDNKPLDQVLVKSWHRRGKQTHIIRTRTGSEGKAAFTLPYAGTWMISLVHMIPVQDVPGIEWDSFWGNLTFELPRKADRQ